MNWKKKFMYKPALKVVPRQWAKVEDVWTELSQNDAVFLKRNVPDVEILDYNPEELNLKNLDKKE